MDFFRNTNANWREWPRSGRSCVRVWTIFQEDSTTLQTDSSFSSWPLKHLNLSHCHILFFILESVVVILYLKDYLSTWTLLTEMSSVSVCELIPLCCMLLKIKIHNHQTLAPHVLAPAPFSFTALKWHGWCWCDIFVFIVT